MRTPSLAVVTMLLDVLGLLVVAVGVAWGLFEIVGPIALVAGGAVALGGSALAERLAGRRAAS